jgi:hypothetical protein
MTMSPTSVRDAQKQYLEYLDALKDGQKAVIDAVEFWSSAFDATRPSSRRTSENVPSNLPPPKEFVESAFSFAERMVAAQKEFALALIDASSLKA